MAKKNNKVNLITRPPVVTVMGHVDHGKTTLLDAIRKTDVAAGEHGGITQHIGAYQIEVSGKKITFIDTPGHAAFSQMRSRGAQVADIVILVVAADDGVMPQTKESIAQIQESKTPIVVAINKMDLPGVHLEKIKRQLADSGVLVEGYGGDVVAVPVSAKAGTGVSELLEMILLLAEMQDLKVDPASSAQALVIESHMDKSRGPVATVIIQEGTLKIGQNVFIEGVKSKIRALTDDKGRSRKEALPADPIEISGLARVPNVGAILSSDEQIIAKKEESKINPLLVPELIGLEEKNVNLILKTDVAGTLEAIMAAFPKEVKIIKAETGDISESDILLAKSSRAAIIGFNVKYLNKNVEKLVVTEKVLVKIYYLIYELLDEIKELVQVILKPKIEEEILGRAEIIGVFNGKPKIAGVKVIEGALHKNDRVRLIHDEEIKQAKIISMKHLKEEINKAEKGTECGLIFEPDIDFALRDLIESFRKI